MYAIHLEPFLERCQYCNIPYDVIGRIETFNEDVRSMNHVFVMVLEVPPPPGGMAPKEITGTRCNDDVVIVKTMYVYMDAVRSLQSSP